MKSTSPTLIKANKNVQFLSKNGSKVRPYRNKKSKGRLEQERKDRQMKVDMKEIEQKLNSIHKKNKVNMLRSRVCGCFKAFILNFSGSEAENKYGGSSAEAEG